VLNGEYWSLSAVCFCVSSVILKSSTWPDGQSKEAINTPFCPLQEKFHTFVLRGLRNISEAP
jgi:hypothetical protein